MELTLRDVTPDDAESLAHVLITASESAFRGLVPDHCLTFTEAESATNWRRFLGDEGLPDDDFLVVALVENKIVGYVYGGLRAEDDLYRGEVRVLKVLPAYHQRGIGRKLISSAAQKLAKKNIYTMRVEVLRINPNRIFYERVGAKFISEYPYDWDGVKLSMCVYGWADTRALY